MHPIFGNPLPADWRILIVDQIKALEKHSCVAGPFGSDISSKYFCESGVPVIRGSNLRDDLTKFVPRGFVFVSPERAVKYKGQHVRANDLVFTCWGTVGQVGIIPGDGPFEEYIISNKQLKLRVDSQIVNPLFVFYYFANPAVIAYVRSRAIGAAVPGINLGILKALPVALPSRSAQDVIVKVLGAYDDLVENNTRRIAILEEMARSLYREWFVEFRFPGHHSARMTQTRIGLVPDTWKIQTTAETFKYSGGSTPSKEVQDYWEAGTIEWYTPTDLTRNKSMFIEASGMRITPAGLEKSSAKLFPPYSVMMTSRATIGVAAINTTVACTNQGFITCIPSPQFPLYLLFYWIQQNVEYFNSLGTGSTFKEVTRSTFKQIPVLVPPEPLVSRFQTIVEPIGAQILTLQRQNANLRATRDLLLPRLISGELDVSQLPDPGA